MDDFSRSSKNLKYLQNIKSVDLIALSLLDAVVEDFGVKQFDEIYMLAAIVGVNQVNSNPLNTLMINTSLNLKFIELISKIRPSAVVFSSTSEVYAGAVEIGLTNVPTSEEAPICFNDITHPRNTYAISKVVGETATIHAGEKFGFKAVNVRYHNVFGPNMGFRHVIPHLIERFFKQENPFKIYGGNQTRAFTYISDAVSGTIGAMEKGHPGSTYHLGASDEITMDELTRFIGDHFKFDGDYENAATFPGSVSRRCPDTKKAARDLDHEATVSWQDGLSETISWYKQYYKDNPNGYPSFYNE